MPRPANVLSPIQQDDAAFEKLSIRIRKYAAHDLAGFGLVSYTTIYKWLRREPINPGMESALVDTVEMADKAAKEAADAAVSRVLELAD